MEIKLTAWYHADSLGDLSLNATHKTLVKFSRPFLNSLQALFQSVTEVKVMFVLSESPHSF